MTEGVGKDIQAGVGVFGHHFEGHREPVQPGTRGERASEEVDLLGDLLRRARLGPLAQEIGRQVRHSCLLPRIGRASPWELSDDRDCRRLVILHQHQPDPVVQRRSRHGRQLDVLGEGDRNEPYNRRGTENGNGMNPRSRTKRHEKEELVPYFVLLRVTSWGRRPFPALPQCLGLSVVHPCFSGISVTTVRLRSLKYLFTTRCTSAAVTRSWRGGYS